MAYKIPSHIQKFKGDNNQSFRVWIMQFEAHCRALDVKDGKKIPALLCCLESSAFSAVTQMIADDSLVTYEDIKKNLTSRFCGVEYKRNLQIKLQSLKFLKGTNINSFMDELSTTIKYLYDIEDKETIRNIALNHITSNLDDSLRQEAKIFQLSGNTSIENLLEFISTKMSMGSFRNENSFETAAMFSNNQSTDQRVNGSTRLDKLELMMETVLKKLDGKGSGEIPKGKPLCNFCHKTGHPEEKCFKKKKCFNCNELGHISKYCKNNDKQHTATAAFEKQDSTEPAHRTVISVNVGTQNIDFLYDTGSQFSILKRSTYDKLITKPPLVNVTKSGIGIDGHQFDFDGLAYLNLTFQSEGKQIYTLEYEPILISKHVTSNIFGAKTENRFKTCVRDLENSTIMYTTKETNQHIRIKCFKEKLISTSAFVEVASSVFIPEKSTSWVKANIRNAKLIDKEENDIYGITDILQNADRLRIGYYTTDDLGKTVSLPVENLAEESIKLKKGEILAEINVLVETSNEIDISSCFAVNMNDARLNTNLNNEENERLSAIISEYKQRIEGSQLNKSKVPYEHVIDLKDNTPVVSKARILPQAYQKDVYKQIDELLEEGIIEISDSPFASPVVPVVKKDGSIRLCCDFRRLNEKTIPKSYPIPRTENLLEDLNHAEVFTILDLKNAYWHIPIREGDKHKTAFVVPNGKYQWNVMPFGLMDAAFSLSYVMNEVLREFEFAKSFYDDCILAGSKEKHFDQIRKVLNKFADYGIHVNLAKCQFMQNEVNFIGHIVDKTGVRPDKGKVSEIIDFQRPSNVNELKSFLGMASYFRKFIDQFSEKSAPLYNLLKRNVNFEWSQTCEDSFTYIKLKLEDPTLLIHPDFDKPFILLTDASALAVGFALTQEVDGCLRPIIYGGRVLSEAEKRYCTTDRELLGIYFAVKRCEYYLLGHDFVVYTDHEPLIHLKAFKEIVNKRYRWIAYLESVNIIVRYIPGKKNVLSDYVSRNIKTEEKWNVIDVNYVELNRVSYTEDELLEKQLNDGDIFNVIDFKTKGNCIKGDNIYKKYNDKLFVENDLLRYKHHGKMLYVCPKELRSELLTLSHNQFYSGHYGIFKTHKRLLEGVWWPNMAYDIQSYIANCKVCIMTKSGKSKSILGNRKFPTKPLEVISIDFIVDLPITSRKNIHILTVVDNFTKYLKCYAIRNRTALTASKFIYDYCIMFGIPEKLYSDRDPAYESELFQQLMRQLGVKKLRTTGYNPKANGLCEKSNGIIKSFLMKYVNFVEQKEWDLWLNELCYAYNSSVHSSTGFSPAELMFGRKFRTPLDIIYGYDQKKQTLFNIQEFREKLHNMYELASEAMNTRQSKFLTYHDSKIKDDNIEENTSVYMYLPRKEREKLALKWDGPYCIKINKHPVYQIEYTKGGKTLCKWTTRDKLRRTEINEEGSDNINAINNDIIGKETQARNISDQIEDIENEDTNEEINRIYPLRRNRNIPNRFGNPLLFC